MMQFCFNIRNLLKTRDKEKGIYQYLYTYSILDSRYPILSPKLMFLLHILRLNCIDCNTYLLIQQFQCELISHKSLKFKRIQKRKLKIKPFMQEIVTIYIYIYIFMCLYNIFYSSILSTNLWILVVMSTMDCVRFSTSLNKCYKLSSMVEYVLIARKACLVKLGC